MKAITVKTPGDANQLEITEVADPVAGPGQVLVYIAATALNRADILQREGKYPPPPGVTDILGLEMAGTVIETGAGVTGFEVGDNVCALLSGGGYAQLIAVDEDMLLKLPEQISFTKAAAIPEAFLTAYQALHQIAKLQKDETVLIHAGASGVGTAAIQLAKHAGAKVVVTASSMKHQRLEDLGTDRCVDYRTEDFADAVLDETDGKGANVILDFVGGGYFEQNLKAAALDGRIVSLAALGGARVENVSLAPILRKRLQITGTTLRSRSKAYKSQLVASFRNEIWPHFADRSLRALVDTIYDWEGVADAHKYMEANANVGKIVLTIGE
ncbi:NAD(P)H-quinone oxidoreductase [Neolewinella aurantiaca]|uniref:NAD(P)H-quinone oxidoreductase n=1 Tax=Neolewinella aurantiaca TaxID=2602767 RepID=A0A5C7FPS8_9BACT|nr:NAD(P)H-quinone oxidoreductase [Neolewinella aurantiaca]TXF89728.1 NAD(P)H-quinone oxidoreductase [Neolewinella aurantiaca]